MYWRNCKVTCFIVLLGLGILGFAIFAIINRFALGNTGSGSTGTGNSTAL